MDKIIPLPKNRFEVFLEVFQNSWRKLMSASLIVALFAIPLVLVVVFSSFIGLEITTGVDQSSTDAVLVATQEYFHHQVNTIFYLFPCFIIFSFGLAGAFSVIKKLIWNEKCSIYKDFTQGIKGNIILIIINGLLMTIIYGANVLIYWFVQFNELSTFVNVLIYSLTIIASIIICLQLVYGYAGMVTYNLTFFAYLKNNLIFSIFAFFPSLGILVLTLLPVAIGALFEFVVGFIIVYTLYALIGFGTLILLVSLNCHHYFDKIINKDQYPSIYRKGLKE